MIEWKDIPGCEGKFQVSKCGRIRRLETRVRSRGGYRTLKERELATFPKSNASSILYAKLRQEDGSTKWFSIPKLLRRLWNDDKHMGHNIVRRNGNFHARGYNYGKSVFIGSYTTFEKAYEAKFKFEMEKEVIS